MQPPVELQGFRTDPPVVVALLLCDAIAIGPNDKITVQGVFDILFTAGYPPAVQGAIYARIAGVREPIDCRFETVAYPNGNVLGVRTIVGTAHVEVPNTPHAVANVHVSGIIPFPAQEAGVVDLRVYCNGVLLGSSPYQIANPGQT